MKNLLKKKIDLFNIWDFITYAECEKNIRFQMDVHRNNIIDLQIFSDQIENEDSLLDHSDDEIVLLLAFTKHLYNRDECLERFKSSDLYKESSPLKNKKLKDRYVIKIKKNWPKLFEIVKFILEDIYGYSEFDTYNVEFYQFDKNNRGRLINHTYISWYEYFFKR